MDEILAVSVKRKSMIMNLNNPRRSFQEYERSGISPASQSLLLLFPLFFIAFHFILSDLLPRISSLYCIFAGDYSD